MDYLKYTDKKGNSYLGYSECDGVFETFFRQISEEEYEELSKLSAAEVKNRIVSERITPYGYYGYRLKKDEKGLCFLGITTGISCD